MNQDALFETVETPDPNVPPTAFNAPLDGPRRYARMDSPVGELLMIGDGQSLTALYMAATPGADWVSDPGAFTQAKAQLSAYFAGELREFDLPLAPAGTAFQLKVWSALTTIPFGHTMSYGALATRFLGQPTASRAVGLANGRNPISIIIPCHRVIGADGALTGYAGGLPRKQRLLALESVRVTG
ncbi:methylated-DNA--[protein]-cysteine S-methyltransferase [Embleya sp. NPDC005575]|uniref:methylated-DNA--[protein]-cysteine S-methyltransferase n=1 Tax=Embleya sp. NPDC005575 TaxID=3156892 RepID=UPI0033A346F6